MSEPTAGEAASPAAPRGLRAAFGLSGGESTPPETIPPPEALRALPEALRDLLRGAHRALRPGQPLPEAELDAQLASLVSVAPGRGLDAMAEQLIRSLLPASTALASTAAPATAGRDVFDAMVAACYQALLARPPGEVVDAWWAEFQPMVEQQGIERFLTHFIALLMSSEEFATLVRRSQDNMVRGQLVPALRGVGGIASHVSLGTDGFTSAMLKRFDRKRWSGPFDWLSATPAMIRAALTDDFETLLDPTAYAAIPFEDRPDARFWRCRNLRYEDRFGHPCISHAADMTDAVGQLYMARCVERFRANLRGLSSKLVLQVAPEGSDPGREFQQTADLLDSFGRNVTFVMVSLLPDHAEGPFPEIEPALRHGPHRLLRMRILSPLDNAQALDMLDEVVMLRAVLAAPGLSG